MPNGLSPLESFGELKKITELATVKCNSSRV
jgi:hypothetical protein